MQMDEGMDTGGILIQEDISIDPRDTAGTLAEKLSALGARLITSALPRIETATLAPVPQDSSRATLAPLLKKEDGLIDWKLPAQEIHDRIRGLSPWPGAYSFLDGKMIKILETEVVPGKDEPGMLYQNSKNVLDIGTGSGLLRIIRIQPEGKKVMAAEEFLRGHRGIAGKKFSEPNTPLRH
jgi:methionyl-tRNA formyltransferase